ncbi:hypothetical protein [Kutzneria sp. NPDC051319]|uniref:hypothetical protein n=1 Tax=Kutzneria sp. NPDC051319 TaxID=3155047 RepID=UPI00342030D1
MGLDYSYCVFVPGGNVARALTELAALAPGDQGSTEVVVPGGKRLTLPFTSGFKTDPIDCSASARLSLDTAILIDVDDDETRRYFSVPTRDEHGRATLGYLYLTVTFVSQMHPQYAELEFTAATTDMSMLMENSASVQSAFTAFTIASGGVCCWLDREWTSLEVRWLNGETRRDTVPGPRYATGLDVAAEWPALG